MTARAARYGVLTLVAALVGSYYLWQARAGNGPFEWGHDLDGYYNLLAQGFASGHLYVPVQPSPQLLALPESVGPEGGRLAAPAGHGALRRPLLPVLRSGAGGSAVYSVASPDRPRYAGELRHRRAVLRRLSVLVRRAAAGARPRRRASRARAAGIVVSRAGRLSIGAVPVESGGGLRGGDRLRIFLRVGRPVISWREAGWRLRADVRAGDREPSAPVSGGGGDSGRAHRVSPAAQIARVRGIRGRLDAAPAR